MATKTILAALVAAAIGVCGVVSTAYADSIFSLVNPFEWFDDDDDWDDWRYGYRPYGWGGPYGYGRPGYRRSPMVIVLPSEGDGETATVYPE